MACCKCCCGNADCAEGQQGKCCCGGTCCQEGEYCCDGECQAGECECGPGDEYCCLPIDRECNCACLPPDDCEDGFPTYQECLDSIPP